MEFQPDYNNLLDVLYNRKPRRLPLYEHAIDNEFIAKYLGFENINPGDCPADLEEYYNIIAGFWKRNTYDSFAFEALIVDILPGHGAIYGGMDGPIQTRQDFDRYPWDKIPIIFWEKYTTHFEVLKRTIPIGMKIYGGCGNGVFEISEDLVGYESLCTLQYTDPDLFADIFIKIGNLLSVLWEKLIQRYDDLFVFYRMGDDLGFKTSTLLEPESILTHIIPQYQRIIDLVHHNRKKFLLHSCGNIFSIMEDLIQIGIDAKHSNEDQIAPFEKWIELYGNRIGLLGGIDVNELCQGTYNEVYKKTFKKALTYRHLGKGWALGSGNSIASYVPVENYIAMIDVAKKIRKLEK